jgi:ferredoxin/flavodoxin---NADP+ reductase
VYAARAMSAEAVRGLSVAVVGSGPAGFYVTDALLKGVPTLRVDLYERLPVPFGLVRFGIAPDHQKIKSVTKVFEKLLDSPRCRLRANVAVGTDLSPAELAEHYDQVVYCFGAAGDRQLGIPGEALPGSHSSTFFVNWYNGHPDAADAHFDLSHQHAVVVGVGNVAMDVARVLVRSPDELAKTDIAEHALAALRESRVRQVTILGRRGAEHAAFDQSEIADIAELDGVRVDVDAAEIEVAIARSPDADSVTTRKLEHLLTLARAPQKPADRVVRLRFLRSPLRLEGEGAVHRVMVGENQVQADGSVRAASAEPERVEAGLVLRAVGYRGQPIEGLPFDERSGVVPNVEGRVLSGGVVLPRVYACGWVKRGPTGVIGTNKSDATATVAAMLEDQGALGADARGGGDAADALLATRGVKVVDAAGWRRIDGRERAPRVGSELLRRKIVAVPALLAAAQGENVTEA